jgi:hypothetical protein
MDARVASLEARRDLTRTWVHVDMVRPHVRSRIGAATEAQGADRSSHATRAQLLGPRCDVGRASSLAVRPGNALGPQDCFFAACHELERPELVRQAAILAAACPGRAGFKLQRSAHCTRVRGAAPHTRGQPSPPLSLLRSYTIPSLPNAKHARV